MAGRRLVDAAKLFNASKSIAQKHIALRSQQLDTYNRTSSLAKAVKSQTDRVTLTAAAAIALSKRFSEEAPSYARAAAERTAGTQHDDGHIPTRDTVRGDAQKGGVEEGLEQDHHYDRSAQNAAASPPPEGELDITQKKAPRQPLPDGTIPTSGATLGEEPSGRDTFSDRPVSEGPDEPLVEHNGQKKGDAKGTRPIEPTESTIPSHANNLQQPPASPQLQKLQEGRDRDVFYTRSVESQQPPSSQPRSQIPEHTEDRQQSDVRVEDRRLNQDVFYSVPQPGQKQVQEEPSRQATDPELDEIPEGINTDVFHSKRVARMLGRDPYSRKEYLEMKGAGRTPFERPGTQKRHPLDDRSVEPTRSADPEPVAQNVRSTTTEKEVQDLASELVKDVQSNAVASEVY